MTNRWIVCPACGDRRNASGDYVSPANAARDAEQWEALHGGAGCVARIPGLSVAALERALGLPSADWAHQCHSVSLGLVRSGLLDGLPGGRPRVARGFAPGISSQHSWAVVGDPYDPDALVVDPTAWSYVDAPVLLVGTAGSLGYAPHGSGSLFDAPMPCSQGGEAVALEPAAPLSGRARSFLTMLGPLDAAGWAMLASCPVAGWPAAEIVAAMDDTPRLRALVPVDRLGMLTDRNPQGLYTA